MLIINKTITLTTAREEIARLFTRIQRARRLTLTDKQKKLREDCLTFLGGTAELIFLFETDEDLQNDESSRELIINDLVKVSATLDTFPEGAPVNAVRSTMHLEKAV
jgi:hypothetical protein